MKDYVLSHDFGYGKENEKINKLKLRTAEDVFKYVEGVLESNFGVGFDSFTSYCFINTLDTKICFEGM